MPAHGSSAGFRAENSSSCTLRHTGIVLHCLRSCRRSQCLKLVRLKLTLGISQEIFMRKAEIVRSVTVRKVRTPQGSTGVNDPPPQGEEQWNRENVRGFSGWERETRKMQKGTRYIFKCSRCLSVVVGVKTAKLCAEQEQIGRRLSAARTKLSGKFA
jgi:hypothetical protein